MEMTIVGLGLVVFAWVLEFFLMGEEKRIDVWFVVVYVLGVGVLVYDGFVSGMTGLAVANLVSLVVAAGVLVRLKFY
ncbi:MAG: hypothetical protein V1888_01805 [archaeon]